MTHAIAAARTCAERDRCEHYGRPQRGWLACFLVSLRPPSCEFRAAAAVCGAPTGPKSAALERTTTRSLKKSTGMNEPSCLTASVLAWASETG